MPIYEYQCEACGETTEALQKISDPPLSDCPHCGKAALRKKISAAAFRLKGGGWYETDFKTAGRKNLAGDGAGSSGGDGAGKGDKSEAGGSTAAGGAAGGASDGKTGAAPAGTGGKSEAAGK
jgi:putative FmdB family regulatory protein